MLLYSRLQFLLLILIHLSIRFTKTKAANDVPVNRLETFSIHDRSKFEKILLSVEASSKTLVEMQREEGINLSQATNDIQEITDRLQTIESQVSQMEQEEVYNEQRFELFQDNYMKKGVQLDDMKRREEKYQLHTNNLIGELDSLIEKVIETQDKLLLDVRKVSMTQTRLVKNVNQLNENIKTDWDKFNTSLRASQQNFTKEMKDVIENFTDFMTAAIDILTHKSTSSSYETSTQTNSKARDDGEIIPNWLGQILNMENISKTTQEEMKSVRSSMDKCTSISERIREDFVVQKRDFMHLVSGIRSFVTNELQKKENDDIDRLSMSFQSSIVPLQKEQRMFRDDCSLIQANGEQIEEKAYYVLEKLFNFITNQTEGIRSELDRLQQIGMERSAEQAKEIQKIKELLNNQKNCAAKEKEVTKKTSTARPAGVQTKRPKPRA